jgi:hypothetical protein
MAETGESYTAALRAITTPSDPQVDWSPLYGVDVTITPPDGPAWRGVVLPPATDTPTGCLRISVSQRPERPPAPGELATVDPWQLQDRPDARAG